MKYSVRVVSNVNVCGGQPVIKSTRIPVRVILSHLAAGESIKQILKDFSRLTEEDVRAALKRAAY